MEIVSSLGTVLVACLIALVLAIHLSAILHAPQHRRIGMALPALLVPGPAWFWIPLHHHDDPAERPAI